MSVTNEDRISRYEAVIRRGFRAYVDEGVIEALVGFLEYNNTLIQGGGTVISLPDGTIPLVESSALAASAMRELTDRILSSKSIQVPNGSIFLGPDIRLSAANRAINIENLTTGRRALILASLYTDTGSETPFTREFGAIGTVDINTTEDATASGSISFPVTTTDNRFIQSFILRSSTALSMVNFRIRLGDASGPIIYQSDNVNITGSGADETFNLANPIILDNNTMITVQADEATGLSGTMQGGVFVPYLRIRAFTFTEALLATRNWVTDQISGGITGSLTLTVNNESTQSYTIVNSDRNTFLAYTGTTAGTWTLPAASGLVTGWGVYITASGSTITLNPDGSDTIDGNASLTFAVGDTYILSRSGTSTWVSYRIDGNAIRLQGVNVSSTAPTDGQVLQYDNATSTYVPGTITTGSATVNFSIQKEATQSYTVVDADRGEFLEYTGTSAGTWTLPAASGLATGWGLYVTASGAAITLSPDGTDTIDGQSSLAIAQGDTYVLSRSGTSTWASYRVDGNAVRIQGVAVSSTAPTDGQILKYNNTSSQYEPAADDSGGTGEFAFSIQKEATQAYTILDADRGEFLEYTGTNAGTWTLPAASGLAAGWGIYITASGSTITLNRAGSDTIDGNTSLAFAVGDTYVIARSGSTTWASYRVDGNAFRLQGIAISTTTPTDGQVLQYDSGTSTYVPGTITAGSATFDFNIQKEATQTYAIVDADRGDFLEYTGTSAGTWTLPAASGLAAGWGVYITATGSTITLNRAGTDTIDGNTSLAFAVGDTYVIARSGSTTWSSYRIDGNAIRIQGIAVSSTTPSNGQVLKYNSTSTQYEPAEDATGMAAVNYSINEQSGAYTILSADRGQYLRYTGNTNGTWTVPESSTLTTGFGTFVSTDTNQLTLNMSGSDTIDGLSAIIVPPRSTYLLSRASSSTFLTYVVDGNALAFQSIAVATTTPSDNQVLQYNATAQQYEPATISGTTPVVLSLHNFSINIPSTIETNTSLGSRTVTYSVTNYSLLTALQLQVNGANVASITLPTSDGQHTASVDLSSVDTSSATTLVFRLQGNASINSNTQTVTVVAPTAMERLYWGVETDNVASTFDTDAAQNQTALSGNIALPTFTGSQYVKLAYPASADPVTSLSIGGLNQLGAFTLSEDALTINTVQYDVLVSNNALDGAVVSGTIITITR